MASKSFSSFFLTNVVGPALLCSASCRQPGDGWPGLQATPAQSLTVAAENALRYETVVSPQWVKALLEFHSPRSNSPRPSTYRNNHFVILEASWAKLEDAKDYLAGHIPGAIHFNTDNFETGYPRWLLRRPEELHRTIGAFGITPQTTVVVYSKQMIAAARVWWVLKYAGAADLRFLNGGFEAWTAAGYAAETAAHSPKPAPFSAPLQKEWLATTEYVRAHCRDDETRLADVRTREEFVGKVSGYDYMDFKGRIPGAIHLGNADDASYLYKNQDGTLRSTTEIRTMWEKEGIRGDREIIFYCGSGWRSSVAFLYAYLMGFEKVRNYSDGWAGWSTVYTPDAQVKGSTPGWRQTRSGNPIEIEATMETPKYNSPSKK